jgi:hypothetical protein
MLSLPVITFSRDFDVEFAKSLTFGDNATPEGFNHD